MTEIHLKTFCEEKSQDAAAQIIGCSQSAVSQMIRAERDIWLVFNAKGKCVDCYERKSIKRTAA